jgi:murein L,D-transpeptidase YcbB/YkuD
MSYGRCAKIQETQRIPDSLLLPQHIENMNITVHERIKTIMVNMERSRWLSHDYTKAKQSIVVNIPSFTQLISRKASLYSYPE